MHEPRCKAGLGLGYAISPTGADHCHNIHDTGYEARIGSGPKAMGIMEPLPSQDLSAAKCHELPCVLPVRTACIKQDDRPG